MAQQNDATTDEPMEKISDEIEAIREATEGTDLWVLVFWGSEPRLFLVERERAPPTEYPSREEPVALIDWTFGEDYAIFAGEGDKTATNHIKTDDERSETVETREEAIEAAERVIAEGDSQ